MSSLYELNRDWVDLQQMLERGDLSKEEVADTLDAMDAEFENKAHGIGCVLANMASDIAAMRIEATRLSDRAAALSNESDKLKSYLLTSMQRRGSKSIKTPLFAFSYRQPSKVAMIDNESEIPSEYFKEIPATKKLNKKALLADLKNGDVKGAHLGEGTINLIIK